MRGTLGANIVIHPRTRKALGARFDEAVANLRYGTIGINAWTGVGYLTARATWGAFPGHTLDDIQSGIGVVHNALLLARPERTVVTGPFRPLRRSLLHGEPSISPTPPWFVDNPHRTHHWTASHRLLGPPALESAPGHLRRSHPRLTTALTDDITDRKALMPTTPVRQADRLYHDLLSPDEVREARSRTRKIAEDSVAPAAGRIANGNEKIDGFPRDVFDSLADAGLYRVSFGREVGGDGLAHPVMATAVAIEELAYYSSSIAAVFDVHCILAGNTLTHGTPAQRKRWLRPVADGTVVGAFATTEPEASSDLSPQAVQTVAVQQGDTWVLNGRKRWISNSPVAGFVVTLARTGDRLSMFVVDTSLPGVRVGEPDQKMGNRGQLTADVWFEDVELSDDALLGGEPGQGLRHALATLTLGRVGIAAAGVGMAQAAFDHAVAHLSTREAFGRKLAANQHWQFLLADRATEIDNARTLYLKAALRRDAGEIFPEPEAAMAKHYGTRLSVDMARDAVQAFGGLGFARELSADGTSGPVETIYRDSKIGEIYEGTNEIQKWVIARTIFGKEITG